MQRIEVVSNDGLTGDRGIGWGGHQLRHTVQADGTEWLIYVKGASSGSSRTWQLMKRTSAGWTQQASGQTNSEAMIARDPATDSVHVIAYPGAVATIYSSPSFTPVTVPGNWPNQDVPYQGIGIGTDGTLVIKNLYDYCTGGLCTANTDYVYASGKWNGSAWNFNPVVRQNIGERYAYDYILPGAFGNMSEFVGVGERDITNIAAGLPNLSASYVWDGVRQFRSGDTTSTAFSTLDVMPKRTQPSTTVTQAAWNTVADAFADSNKRVFSFAYVSDPAGPGGNYLTVKDSAGNQLYQGLISYQNGGNCRVFEDGKNRLWVLISNPGSNGASVQLFRLNSDFTLGAMTDLSSGFSGFQYEGSGHIAVPRGGSVIGNTISGHYNYGSQTVAYKIRLPD